MTKKKITLLGVNDAGLAKKIVQTLKDIASDGGRMIDGVPRRGVTPNVPAGSGTAAPPSEQYRIVFAPLYGFIGDPVKYNGKHDDNEKVDDDVLYAGGLENNIGGFNVTKLGLAHKVGETLNPIPVLQFVDIENELFLFPSDERGNVHYFGAKDVIESMDDIEVGCTALAYISDNPTKPHDNTSVSQVFSGQYVKDSVTEVKSWEWVQLSGMQLVNNFWWKCTYHVADMCEGMVVIAFDDAAHSESGKPTLRVLSRLKQKKDSDDNPLYYAPPTHDILNGFYQYSEGACGEWDHCYKTDVKNTEYDKELPDANRQVAFLYKLLESIGKKDFPSEGLARVDYSSYVPWTTVESDAMQYPLYLVAVRGAIGGCLPKDTVIDAKHFKEYDVDFRLEDMGTYPDVGNALEGDDEERDDPVVNYKLLIAEKKEAGDAVGKIWFEGEVTEDAFYLLKVKADFTQFEDADGNYTYIEAIQVDMNETDHIKLWYEGQTYDELSSKVDYYYFRWVRYKMVNGVPDMDDTTACSYDCKRFAAAFARLNGYLLTVFMEQLPSMTYYPLKDQKCWYMVNDAECSPHARPKYSNRENVAAENGTWYFDEKIENVWASFHPCREVQ